MGCSTHFKTPKTTSTGNSWCLLLHSWLPNGPLDWISSINCINLHGCYISCHIIYPLIPFVLGIGQTRNTQYNNRFIHSSFHFRPAVPGPPRPGPPRPGRFRVPRDHSGHLLQVPVHLAQRRGGSRISWLGAHAIQRWWFQWSVITSVKVPVERVFTNAVRLSTQDGVWSMVDGCNCKSTGGAYHEVAHPTKLHIFQQPHSAMQHLTTMLKFDEEGSDRFRVWPASLELTGATWIFSGVSSRKTSSTWDPLDRTNECISMCLAPPKLVQFLSICIRGLHRVDPREKKPAAVTVAAVTCPSAFFMLDPHT